MVISDRLRAIREKKALSQGDIEKCTGLLRCYLSRVENGHAVPWIETMEKMGLEVPMYQHFYDGETPPEVPSLLKGLSSDGVECGSDGESADFLKRLRQLLGRLSNEDRKLILHMTFQLARRKRP
jgi:transcriptional regulator with XRE-family HTH domain